MKKLNKHFGVSTKENKNYLVLKNLKSKLKHRGLKEKDKMDDK